MTPPGRRTQGKETSGAIELSSQSTTLLIPYLPPLNTAGISEVNHVEPQKSHNEQPPNTTTTLCRVHSASALGVRYHPRGLTPAGISHMRPPTPALDAFPGNSECS